MSTYIRGTFLNIALLRLDFYCYFVIVILLLLQRWTFSLSLDYFVIVSLFCFRCKVFSNMGKTLHSQTRNLILKVLSFFESEKANKQYIIPVDQAVKRTCAATGIPKSTLMKIKKGAKELLHASPPRVPHRVKVLETIHVK